MAWLPGAAFAIWRLFKEVFVLKKHHLFMLVGSVLTLLLPVYAPLHGAGIGVLVSGVLDWAWSRFDGGNLLVGG